MFLFFAIMLLMNDKRSEEALGETAATVNLTENVATVPQRLVKIIKPCLLFFCI